jgi:hypothetical protein
MSKVQRAPQKTKSVTR